MLGAERVRKRPSVIFGSDGLEGCEHAVFEILSNAIDEAREGFGNIITVTRYEDKSIEVEDFARLSGGLNEKEQRYNWELIFQRNVRRRRIKKQRGRKLRVLARPQRPRRVRHAVRLGIHGCDHLARREENTP